MTNEQIKELAADYLYNEFTPTGVRQEDWLKCFTAGAVIALENIWVSVKDKQPKKGDYVITRSVHIISGGGEYNETEQYLAQQYNGEWGTDRLEQHRYDGVLYDCVSKVTHWMKIPGITPKQRECDGLERMRERYKNQK